MAPEQTNHAEDHGRRDRRPDHPKVRDDDDTKLNANAEIGDEKEAGNAGKADKQDLPHERKKTDNV